MILRQGSVCRQLSLVLVAHPCDKGAATRAATDARQLLPETLPVVGKVGGRMRNWTIIFVLARELPPFFA